MRSQSLCLLERLAYLGPGAKAAAERRRVTQQLEERQRRELPGCAHEAGPEKGWKGICALAVDLVPQSEEFVHDIFTQFVSLKIE